MLGPPGGDEVSYWSFCGFVRFIYVLSFSQWRDHSVAAHTLAFVLFGQASRLP